MWKIVYGQWESFKIIGIFEVFNEGFKVKKIKCNCQIIEIYMYMFYMQNFFVYYIVFKYIYMLSSIFCI